LANETNLDNKYNSQILSQIIAAQNVMYLYNTKEKSREFLYPFLKTIPGIDDCSICYKGDIYPSNQTPTELSSECPYLNIETINSNGEPTCKLVDNSGHKFLLKTKDNFYGCIQIKVTNQNTFQLYLPFIQNFLNSATLTIENNDQKQRLAKHSNELEQEVKARTLELKDSEENYRSLVEGTDDLVTKVDSKGKFIFVNQASQDIFGLPSKECINKSAFSFVHPQDKEKTEHNFNIWIKKSLKKVSFENRQISINGKSTDVLWKIKLNYDKKGKVTVIEAIGRDITKINKAQEEQNILYKRIKTYNSDLKRLLYVASHDFRSPLVTIAGFSYELIEAVKELVKEIEKISPSPELTALTNQFTNNTLPEMLSHIDLSIAEMGKYIDGLVDLSSVGGRKIIKNSVNMERLLKDILTMLDSEIKKVHGQITITELPICNSDTTLLKTIFSNLISNSLKYSSSERQCKISISAHLKEDSILFQIKDNGIGIPKEKQDKVFDFFYRLNSNIEGIGIGLSLVKWAIHKLDGSISLTSAEGTGTTISFTLPK
jgi:PAS domain S-box-containing protein